MTNTMLTFALTAAVIVLVADRVVPRAEPVQVEVVQVEPVLVEPVRAEPDRVKPDASEPYVLIGTWRSDAGIGGGVMTITQEFSSEVNCKVGAEIFRAHVAIKDDPPDPKSILKPIPKSDYMEILTDCIPK